VSGAAKFAYKSRGKRNVRKGAETCEGALEGVEGRALGWQAIENLAHNKIAFYVEPE
jgi:hypothetical protein